MKATLEFNLPEEKEDFDACSKGMDWALLVWNLEQEAYHLKKNGETVIKLDVLLDLIYDQMGKDGLCFPQ